MLKKLRLPAALLITASASPAIAQDAEEPGITSAPTDTAKSEDRRAGDGEWSGYIAAGVGFRNEYIGSKHLEPVPAVLGRIAYRTYFLEVQGQQARLNLSPLENLTFGPSIDFENGRDNDVKNVRVARLPKIGEAFQVGGFLGYRFGDVLRQADEFSVQLTYLRDVSNTYDGGIAQAQVAYGTNVGNRWSIGGNARVSYVDRNYARTYFGITPSQSAVSGLAVYDLKAGVRDVQVGGRLGYALNRRWSIQALGNYRRLLGNFADSPVVREGGSANQISGALGIAFRF